MLFLNISVSPERQHYFAEPPSGAATFSQEGKAPTIQLIRRCEYMEQWKKNLLIGIIITLTSQLYWDFFADGFRISAAVILLPVLLMTMAKEQNSMVTGIFVGALVVPFRLAINLLNGTDVIQGITWALPNGLYYAFYGTLFFMIVKNKNTVSFTRLILSIFACDFCSNVFEVWLRSRLDFSSVGGKVFLYLIGVALVRTLLAGIIFFGETNYHALLTKAEHENRYQRLFLMTTRLKSEIYFMKKNSTEIESAMCNAYQLYEKLLELNVPTETTKLALAIARDIHEVKKDYTRLIQGIEKEIGEQRDEEEMSFKDLLQILQDSTYRMLEIKHLGIRLEFQSEKDFTTKEHYLLMAILKDMVNNAIEAIESVKKSGCIRLLEKQESGNYVFVIADDGPGISEKNLENIFQMGFSTKFDYKTGDIYRGVGLSGVKMVVEEKLHGEIAVTTQLGFGTEFCVKIPMNMLEGE